MVFSRQPSRNQLALGDPVLAISNHSIAVCQSLPPVYSPSDCSSYRVVRQWAKHMSRHCGQTKSFGPVLQNSLKSHLIPQIVFLQMIL